MCATLGSRRRRRSGCARADGPRPAYASHRCVNGTRSFSGNRMVMGRRDHFDGANYMLQVSINAEAESFSPPPPARKRRKAAKDVCFRRWIIAPTSPRAGTRACQAAPIVTRTGPRCSIVSAPLRSFVARIRAAVRCWKPKGGRQVQSVRLRARARGTRDGARVGARLRRQSRRVLLGRHRARPARTSSTTAKSCRTSPRRGAPPSGGDMALR